MAANFASGLRSFITLSAKVLIVIYYLMRLSTFFILSRLLGYRYSNATFYNKFPNYDHNVPLIICYDKKLIILMPVKNVRIYGITAYDKYRRM
jgi:hypothetical protein